jgi:hypothetical protein
MAPQLDCLHQLAPGPVSLVLTNGGPASPTSTAYVTIADAFVLMLIEESKIKRRDPLTQVSFGMHAACTFPASQREATPGLVPRCEQLDACLPGSFRVWRVLLRVEARLHGLLSIGC